MATSKTCERWTQQEVKTLRIEWGLLSSRTLSEKLSRHTWRGIILKAYKLGLKRGVPQGHEYILHAAKRTGFDRNLLWKIIKRYDVPTGRVYRASAPSYRDGRSIRRHVDVDLLDEAITLWMSLETIKHAAIRLDLAKETLSRLLKENGYTVRAKSPFRLESEEYDRIVAKYRASCPKTRREAGKKAAATRKLLRLRRQQVAA